MSITTDQLKQALECYMFAGGCIPPDFILDSIVAAVNNKEQCMIDAGYPQYQIDELLITTAVILALYRAGSILKSRSVDDMSETTENDLNQSIQNLESLIPTLDPNQCVADLLPTRPESSFLFVSKGCTL